MVHILSCDDLYMPFVSFIESRCYCLVNMLQVQFDGMDFSFINRYEWFTRHIGQLVSGQSYMPEVCEPKRMVFNKDLCSFIYIYIVSYLNVMFV